MRRRPPHYRPRTGAAADRSLRCRRGVVNSVPLPTPALEACVGEEETGLWCGELLSKGDGEGQSLMTVGQEEVDL